MQLGLLADIHEEKNLLEAALGEFSRRGVDQVVVLGDIFETGRRLDPIIRLLDEAGAVGVWGNHELGLCHEPEPDLVAKFSPPVTAFMARLGSRWERGRFLITHALPTVDPTDPVAYYESPRPHDSEGRAAAFARFPERVMLMGHYHRWLAATPEQVLPWQGDGPLDLSCWKSLIVVVHAVQDGWCATLDADRGILLPLHLKQHDWLAGGADDAS